MDLPNFSRPRRISIHAPAQGATRNHFHNSARKQFQSTLPHRERRGRAAHRNAQYDFNPRSRTGSDNSEYVPEAGRPYFNPRSRTGSDAAGQRIETLNTISIHAPAQGATIQNMSPKQDGPISIHAPAQGATPLPEIRSNDSSISIHAPAQGATGKNGPIRPAGRFQSTLPHRERHSTSPAGRSTFSFQSTLPHRERPYNTILAPYLVKFQSTLPHRERHASAENDNLRIDFNPRSRTGSDLRRRKRQQLRDISIHAPAQGATSTA